MCSANDTFFRGCVIWHFSILSSAHMCWCPCHVRHQTHNIFSIFSTHCLALYLTSSYLSFRSQLKCHFLQEYFSHSADHIRPRLSCCHDTSPFRRGPSESLVLGYYYSHPVTAKATSIFTSGGWQLQPGHRTLGTPQSHGLHGLSAYRLKTVLGEEGKMHLVRWWIIYEWWTMDRSCFGNQSCIFTSEPVFF